MNSLLRKSLLSLSLFLPTLCQAADLAIVGARIEIGNGQVIENGQIMIRGGKIWAVGPSISIPEGTETIDAKGFFVYPGFIDAYSTKGLKLPDPPAGGSPPDSRTTAQASMWHENQKGIRADIIAAKCLDLGSSLKDNYNQGITSALLAPGSGAIRGIASVVDYSDTPSALKPFCAAEVSLRSAGGGRGGGGGGAQGYPGTLFGITAVVRQTLADAETYASDSGAKKNAGLENLKPLVGGTIPLAFVADTGREIVRANRIADEFGLKMVIVGGRESYRAVDLLKSKNIPVILSLDLGIEPIRKASNEPDSTPQAVLDDRYKNYLERAANIKVLSEAGVPIAFSTMGTSSEDYLKSVRKVIATGVTREAALRALTSGAASILGVSDKVGTIESGKNANLVIMSGDFADAKSEIRTVIIEGKRVELKKAVTK